MVLFHIWSCYWHRNNRSNKMGVTKLNYYLQKSLCWETNIRSASIEILRLLRNPNVHCRFQKNPLLVSTMSHLCPVHTCLSHFFRFYFNSTVACLRTEAPSSDCWLVLFQSSPVVPTRNYYTFKTAIITRSSIHFSYKTSNISSTVDLFGASDIHLETANH
jgi:hypothetical protein